MLSPAQDSKSGSFDTLKNGGMLDIMSPRSTTAMEFVRGGKSFTSVSTSTSTSLHHHQNNLSCATSPVLLPDIRNIVTDNQGATQSVKTPPPPPPRWAKPGFSQSQSNFTVTTTVTFNVNQTTNDVNASQVRLIESFYFIIYIRLIAYKKNVKFVY